MNSYDLEFMENSFIVKIKKSGKWYNPLYPYKYKEDNKTPLLYKLKKIKTKNESSVKKKRTP